MVRVIPSQAWAMMLPACPGLSQFQPMNRSRTGTNGHPVCAARQRSPVRWLQVPLGCIRLSPSCPFRVLHTFLQSNCAAVAQANAHSEHCRHCGRCRSARRRSRRGRPTRRHRGTRRATTTSTKDMFLASHPASSSRPQDRCRMNNHRMKCLGMTTPSNRPPRHCNCRPLPLPGTPGSENGVPRWSGDANLPHPGPSRYSTGSLPTISWCSQQEDSATSARIRDPSSRR